MSSRQSMNIHSGTLVLGNPQQMVEPRRGQAIAPPTAHGGSRRLGIDGNLTGAAQRIDQGIRKSIHVPQNAIIETLMQPEKFDLRNCDYRISLVQERMNLAELKARLKAAGIKQVHLANALGITPVKVSLSLNGQRRFTVEETDIIRQMLEPARLVNLPIARPLPVIGQVVASKWERAVQQTTTYMPAPEPSLPSRAFALDVVGDSMDKYVQDGGRVIVDPDDKDLYPKRFYVVLNGNGETTFKRFFADPARLEPCSKNPNHKPLLLGGGETFTIVGRVIWRASRMPDDD